LDRGFVLSGRRTVVAGNRNRTNTGADVQDKQIIARVDELVDEERQLRRRLAAGELTAAEEHTRLQQVEEELDQCWDLLRQRRAKQEFGQDPDDAAPRPVSEVESYLQ
jgi:hypothetical protein